MTIPTQAALAAAAGEVRAAAGLPARLRFSTDTRTLAPGDVFVALRGARFDGHAYVREALAAGAACVVVDDGSVVPDDASAIVVPDTLAAYLAFAGVARAQSSARVVAITGSTGKTTTKALLAQLLERTAHGRVIATHANENNAIGVAKLLLGMPHDAAFVVVEFGARHYGEIEPLARAALPDVAVLTNIGDAHLEIMGSRERLAQTKWGIFATGARRVLDAGDPVSVLRAAAEPASSRGAASTLWFTVRQHAGPALGNVAGAALGLFGRKRLVYVDAESSREFAVDVRVEGEHNLHNVAAAAAAAIALGVDAAAVAAALADLHLPEGRYERVALGDLHVIYDAYNASMSGSLATLGSFAREPAARRIAVLGSMAELGSEAADMHARVGEAAARSGVAALLVGGDFARDLARGARSGGLPDELVVTFENNAAATQWLRENVRPGDVVLLKASRRYKLEEVLDGLRSAYA
ncbi:MAG: UDP-N-acetylmuramoyl-tripeptide--D-alanyl-D-alanine ligase [Candidatus Eremiobacteraeota bacterium]|nr:UDP-N-acetylmuramoyl-tripeptide--D-alanyl-D-alanine ligase [Candidatus Eremiobacteraeota bacterium]